eukprot:1159639-Pelagomonas_calceolata.AAC.2
MSWRRPHTQRRAHAGKRKTGRSGCPGISTLGAKIRASACLGLVIKNEQPRAATGHAHTRTRAHTRTLTHTHTQSQQEHASRLHCTWIVSIYNLENGMDALRPFQKPFSQPFQTPIGSLEREKYMRGLAIYYVARGVQRFCIRSITACGGALSSSILRSPKEQTRHAAR